MMRAVAVVLAALLLAGCGELAPAEDGGGFAGQAYQGTGLTMAGGAPPAANPGDLSLSFSAPGRITASAGCNTITGAGRIRDGVLTTEDLAITELACEPSLASQEQWWLQFLAGQPSVRAGDRRLVLSTPAATVELTSLEALPDAPLAETLWRGVSLAVGEGPDSAVVQLPPQEPLLLQVTGGQLVLTVPGCGELRTAVEVGEDELRFDPAPLAGCPVEGLAEVFGSGSVQYRIEGGRLAVTGPGASLDLRA